MCGMIQCANSQHMVSYIIFFFFVSSDTMNSACECRECAECSLSADDDIRVRFTHIYSRENCARANNILFLYFHKHLNNSKHDCRRCCCSVSSNNGERKTRIKYSLLFSHLDVFHLLIRCSWPQSSAAHWE